MSPHSTPLAKRTAKSLLAALILSAPLFAASPGSRHAVYSMDESEREANAPAIKTLLYQDTAQVRVSGMEALPCGEFYAIQAAAPATPVAVEDTPKRTAWAWAGATGVVMAAGVAAWVILSGDEPQSHPVVAVMD